MPRQWIREKVNRQGRYIGTGYNITCDECGTVQGIATPMSLEKAQRQIPREFRKRGWEVGKDPRDDVCPACLLEAKVKIVSYINQTADEMGMPVTAAMTPEGRVSVKSDIPKEELIAMVSSPNVVALNPNSEPPREMTRTDRRLIIEKITEVYIDENTGYSSDWTDDRIAKQLDMPRAWVAQLRDENFGPERSEAVTKVVENWKQLKAEVDSVLADINAAATMHAEQLARMVPYKERLQHCEKEIKKLAGLAR